MRVVGAGERGGGNVAFCHGGEKFVGRVIARCELELGLVLLRSGEMIFEVWNYFGCGGGETPPTAALGLMDPASLARGTHRPQNRTQRKLVPSPHNKPLVLPSHRLEQLIRSLPILRKRPQQITQKNLVIFGNKLRVFPRYGFEQGGGFVIVLSKRPSSVYQTLRRENQN